MTLRMIIGFCLAGVLGFLVEICLIKSGMSMGLGAIIPRFASLPAAIATTFLTNRFISFSNYSPVKKLEVLAYFFAMLVGASFSFILYSSLIIMNVKVELSLAIATICTAIVNFVMSRKLLVQKKH
ncbi:GtrA family protein [Alphaproteobacteria bacterium]|nr:GtrA family protein [Alphaproteobacteria bacterium]